MKSNQWLIFVDGIDRSGAGRRREPDDVEEDYEQVSIERYSFCRICLENEDQLSLGIDLKQFKFNLGCVSIVPILNLGKFEYQRRGHRHWRRKRSRRLLALVCSSFRTNDPAFRLFFNRASSTAVEPTTTGILDCAAQFFSHYNTSSLAFEISYSEREARNTGTPRASFQGDSHHFSLKRLAMAVLTLSFTSPCFLVSLFPCSLLTIFFLLNFRFCWIMVLLFL